MNTLCLTGWQQQLDALATIAPPDALHMDYAGYDSVERLMVSLPQQVDRAIGWSLGGQLLVRAITGGYVKARRLVLLGAPFQFMASEQYPHGMQKDAWGGIRESYHQQPGDMIRQFSGHIAAGDSFAPRILRSLNASLAVWAHGLYWLDELGRFSCSGLNFGLMPQTLIIHGRNDRVIHPEQANLFAEYLPQSMQYWMDNCGHAPHLHDPDTLRKLIADHV